MIAILVVAATFYVSPTGSDTWLNRLLRSVGLKSSERCTVESPCTLDEALGRARAGDKIVFPPGDYLTVGKPGDYVITDLTGKGSK